jgi:hypothetical protein
MADIESPLEEGQTATLVRGSVTGFEQGITALAGLFTAGPLGALASWAAIRGVQGKWTPWFILGIPSAIAINAFYFGVFIMFGSAYNRIQESSSSSTASPAVQQLTQPAAGTANSPTSAVTSSEYATITLVEDSTPKGLRIATGRLIYNDGDALTGKFRVYCPTSQIRPVNFVLRTSSGAIKKQGSWWEESFAPKYPVERELVNKTCH